MTWDIQIRGIYDFEPSGPRNHDLGGAPGSVVCIPSAQNYFDSEPVGIPVSNGFVVEEMGFTPSGAAGNQTDFFFDFFEQPFDFVKSVNLEILSKCGGADRAG